MRLRLAVVLAAGLCCGMASAQMNAPAAKVAVGEKMAPAKALDEMLNLFEQEAVGVAKAMPADKYDFAPAAGTFAAAQGAKFDGVRTFAAQVSHLIDANYYFYGSLSGIKPDVDMKALHAMKTKEELVKALAASFAFAHKANATITAENAFDTIKGEDGMHTRATLSAFAVAHGNDHYGQMVEYLRMNGVIPPGPK